MSTKRSSDPPIIALTGSLGSGKSTAAQILASLGFRIVDADSVARQVTLPGNPALNEIRESFGPTTISADGSLDRARLADLVFSDSGRRRTLESILHPRIRRLAQQTLLDLRTAGIPAVYDVPLYFEAALDKVKFEDVINEQSSLINLNAPKATSSETAPIKIIDELRTPPANLTEKIKNETWPDLQKPFFRGSLLIAAPRELCIQRAMQRDGLTRAQAEARLNTQLPIEEKIKRATWIIYNTGSIEQLTSQLKRWAVGFSS